MAKFFLPEEQRAAIERIARTNDRLEALTLTWGGPQPEAAEVLRELLRRRIATFNARGMRGLGELCAGSLRRTIEDEMLKVAGSQQTRGDIAFLPWARAYNLALNNKNVLLFSTTRTEAREALFKGVGPILKSNFVLFAR